MTHLKWLPMLVLGSSLALPAHAADPNKVLRVAFNAPETGFDPAKVNDVYSLGVIENINEPLMIYGYLEEPLKLRPNTISAMPEFSDGGKVITFHIKPGIYFADDPAFKGKKRELTAADYAYSFKRFADPVVNSPNASTFTDFIVGMDEASARASKSGHFNYDAPIAGVQTPDRYTLKLTLKKPGYVFLYSLGSPIAGAVAREVIEAYGKDTLSHPVGSGPFRLAEWKPGNRIVLTANPSYRKVVFNEHPANPGDAALAAKLNGKTLPMASRIDIKVIEEEQPRWLSFLNKQLDVTAVPKSAMKTALHVDPATDDTTLNPKLAKRGIKLSHSTALNITYAFFNLKDPVVGGYSKDKIALRRAIAMAYPVKREVIPLLYGNQAAPVQGIVPAGMVGFNPKLDLQVPYDPATANALLDEFGYKIGPDGYRTLPNGKSLLVEQATQGGGFDKQLNQIWQKTFDSIKVRVRFKVAKWNENLKATYAYKLQMWTLGGFAATPDGDDFVQSFSSKLIGQGNKTGFSVPAYDRAYDQSQLLPDGPERQALFDKMNKLVAAYQPYVLGVSMYTNSMSHGYVQGYKPHPINSVGGFWRYVDIAPR